MQRLIHCTQIATTTALFLLYRKSPVCVCVVVCVSNLYPVRCVRFVGHISLLPHRVPACMGRPEEGLNRRQVCERPETTSARFHRSSSVTLKYCNSPGVDTRTYEGHSVLLPRPTQVMHVRRVLLSVRISNDSTSLTS